MLTRNQIVNNLVRKADNGIVRNPSIHESAFVGMDEMRFGMIGVCCKGAPHSQVMYQAQVNTYADMMRVGFLRHAGILTWQFYGDMNAEIERVLSRLLSLEIRDGSKGFDCWHCNYNQNLRITDETRIIFSSREDTRESWMLEPEQTYRLTVGDFLRGNGSVYRALRRMANTSETMNTIRKYR